LGILNGVADNAMLDTDSNNDKDAVARVFVTPFKGFGFESLKVLGIGVSGTYGNQQKGTATSPNLPSYRTAGQTTFFSYGSGVVSNGQHIRYSPQANFYWGPFGFFGEYAVLS
jgi:phosphate-selective porin OprO/OprP